jgi:membrane associated rhomboid family serine protease
MGIYDRDYSREPQSGFQLGVPASATMQLIVVTGLVYLAQFAFPVVNDLLALKTDWFRRPWTAYQLLTYGFLHSERDVAHILVNMLVLWMFGREIEMRYGKREFLLFYLTGIIAAGTVWSLSEYGANLNNPNFSAMIQTGQVPTAVGASGALAALVVLFAFNWPHRQVLLFFIIPMPMWVAAALGILFDVRGAMQRSGDIAFTCHLGGALYGLAYYKFGWRLSQFWPSNLAMPKLPGRGPKLRVHDPEDEEGADDLSQQVDRILEKIQQQGQDSLTWKERRTLEKASKQYQEKRK